MQTILPTRLPDDQSPRFIGIDLAKAESQLALLDASGKQIHCIRFASTRENFAKLAAELSPLDAVAMEATTNAFSIARILLPSGARVVISDPLKTKVIATAKVKTDKIDARVLAELLRVDYLPTVWLPDLDTEQLRHLMSDRQSLVDRRTELKNRLHAVLHRELLTLERSDLFGNSGQQALAALLNDPSLNEMERYRLQTTLAEIQHTNAEIESCEKRLAAFICQRPKLLSQLDILVSITGISLVVGAGLLAAIGDIKRFSSADKVAAYFGLVPSTYQSGNAKAFHGRITKQGRAQARWLLIEAAQHLKSAPSPLRALYDRIARKRGHNVAVVAVARKLAELVWHLLTKGEDYLYAMPRLTDEKRARIRQFARATGVKAQSGVKKGATLSPLYGTGEQGRKVKTEIVRTASLEAEQCYTEIVAARHLGVAAQLPSDFNPTKPNVVDWQKVLEKAAASLAQSRRPAQTAEENLSVSEAAASASRPVKDTL